MGYSMEQMFDVVLDVSGYEQFLPWCQSSVVLEHRPKYMLAQLRIGISPLTEKYISKVTYNRPFSIIAESKQGRLFNHLVNHWRFAPGLKSHPNSCVVDFSVSFEFKSAFQSKLGNVFFDETAKAMTSAFYTEAQKRYGKESVPSMKIQIVPKSNNNGK
jgi:coenzyme Q-binding protein COQ10